MLGVLRQNQATRSKRKASHFVSPPSGLNSLIENKKKRGWLQFVGFHKIK
jgi:hypothetical protein